MGMVSQHNVRLVFFSIYFAVALVARTGKKGTQQPVAAATTTASVYKMHSHSHSISSSVPHWTVRLKWRWMIYRNGIIHSQSGFCCLTFCKLQQRIDSAVTHTMRTLLSKRLFFHFQLLWPLGKFILSLNVGSYEQSNCRGKQKTMPFHVNLWHLSAHLFTNRQVSASCNCNCNETKWCNCAFEKIVIVIISEMGQLTINYVWYSGRRHQAHHSLLWFLQIGKRCIRKNCKQELVLALALFINWLDREYTLHIESVKLLHYAHRTRRAHKC